MAVNSICSIPECGKPADTAGLCLSHYNRKRRHGTPFGGRTGHGVAKRFYETVVRHFQSDECLFWPYYRSIGGYGVLLHNGAPRIVSRLICEEQYGPPSGKWIDAAHSCGKGHLGCVNPRHVSWKTRIENKADSFSHGTVAIGSKNGKSKLTDQDVLAIRRLRGIQTQSNLAKRFGVSKRQIGDLQTGRAWKHLMPLE